MAERKLSPIEHKYYSAQMSIDGIGVEGQERLLNSTVAVVGLSAIGIAVVRGLVAAGVGKIHVIDDSTVDETSLSNQTLFDVDDIGKLKCIVLKDKELWKRGKDRLHLHGVKISSQNAHLVIPEDCNLIVCAIHRTEIINTVLEQADMRNLCVIGGGAHGWAGVFGVYGGKDNQRFKEIVLNHYGQQTSAYTDTSISGLAFSIGGMMTSLSLARLLGEQVCSTSLIYRLDAKNYSIQLLHEVPLEA